MKEKKRSSSINNQLGVKFVIKEQTPGFASSSISSLLWVCLGSTNCLTLLFVDEVKISAGIFV